MTEATPESVIESEFQKVEKTREGLQGRRPMAEATPESVIESEFQKVEKTREGLLTKRAEIDQQLQEVEQRFTNLRNALAALQGKFNPPTRGPSEQRKSRASSSGRAPRGSREQLKNRISDLLKQHPEGLVANQITTAQVRHRRPDVRCA
jgi:chromosome segregation ATPase